MRVVHNSDKQEVSDNILENARALEKDGELEKAAAVYQKALKQDQFNEEVYDRLMIIYRKEKDYTKELNIINAGIKVYENFYRSSSKLVNSKKILELSRSLLRSTGLADKKGKLLYEPEPISRWKKRRALVEKKIGK